ncbi:MAG: D-tyrosyl-tRNA(Tyr) deacylase [Piscirickettsiaceae bacterium]|nr:MAG: D-tyrosyl-tRNA(Tyr) deacylase [Piscirickettsiaceae bacterium]PCH85592.1 MAG: D-tyrosyl-tRNA(Tyr) deacylase [Piscirickettsiaceae bacterium]
MLTVIQRVVHGSVVINGQLTGDIKQGIVALIAIEKADGEAQAKQLIDRILNYRIFADDNDKMNLSLRDINGGLLLIPQFTLAADTRKGNRPSFTPSASPTIAKPLFQFVTEYAKQQYTHVSCGEFGADMQVSLCNDGPVTFILKVN